MIVYTEFISDSLEGYTRDPMIDIVRTDDGTRRHYFSMMGGGEINIYGQSFTAPPETNQIKFRRSSTEILPGP